MIDRRHRSSFRISVLATIAAFTAPWVVACGKKGPPLPPLRLVPAPVAEVTARRSADRVELSFVLPTTNQNGPGRVELGRVDVYAVTIAPGAAAPANADLLTRTHLIGSIPVRPAPREGEERAPGTPADTRPGPGERATFVEELTAEAFKPAVLPQSATTAARDAAPPGLPPPRTGLPDFLLAAGGVSPAGRTADLHPTRIYVMRGATPGGRPGAPGPRIAVPLAPTPAPPTGLTARLTERAVVLEWRAPVAEPGGTAPSFNVYRADAADTPLNRAPIAATEFEQPGVVFGEERCFSVRTVTGEGSVAVVSEASAPHCVTPRDVFPPAAPAGLQVVAAPGAVELSWNANAESDVAGYVVLRGEAPGDTLQPLMTTPTRETTWRDTTAQSGVRYVYAVIAVDTATPPNASPQSARQEVTAR